MEKIQNQLKLNEVTHPWTSKHMIKNIVIFISLFLLEWLLSKMGKIAIIGKETGGKESLNVAGGNVN